MNVLDIRESNLFLTFFLLAVNSLTVGAVLALVALSSARTVRQNQRAHFLGDGSNDVAVNILKSLKNSKENAVFSPLGYTTILAVLTEGARENTRNQLVSSLKLPEDTYAVRSTYKRILSEMMERDVMNKPQFQNWFYVYKNYSVEESYKNLLKDNYLIDVKEVDKYEFDEDEEESSSAKPMEIEGTTAEQPSQPVEMDDTNDKIVEESVPDATTKKAESSEEKNESTDKSKESTEKKGSKEKESEENESKEDESSEGKSKEDESKEDSGEEKEKPFKKPSNVMKIKEKGNKDKPTMDVKESGSKGIYKSEENDSAPDAIKKEPEAMESLTTDKPSEEAVQSEVQAQSTDVKAVQVDGSHTPTIDFRSRTKRDMASALSVNKLIDNEKQISLKRMSRMMAFNALYFQGNWTSKFSLKQEKMPFRTSATDQKMIQVLHAEGEFETGRVPDLDAWALDLPYQGERYSLLILVPASDDGLDGLIQRLDGFSFYNIDKHLTKLPAQVCIPKLRFYTISKPKDAFIKSGITDLFTEDADLSGISGSKGLYLEELVQIVTFDIDENESSYNYLTTSDVSDTRSTPVNFSADQPFLFFLRDKVENLNIVTGMVIDPTAEPLLSE